MSCLVLSKTRLKRADVIKVQDRMALKENVGSTETGALSESGDTQTTVSSLSALLTFGSQCCDDSGDETHQKWSTMAVSCEKVAAFRQSCQVALI